MSEKDNEPTVMVKGAYGISRSIPLSELEEYRKREAQREKDTPQEEFDRKLKMLEKRAATLRSAQGKTQKTKEP